MGKIKEILNKKKQKGNLPETFLKEGQKKEGSLNIAHEFNNYFVNVGPRLANSIKHKSHPPDEYLNNPNLRSIFIMPTTDTEILKIVGKMKSKSSCGYDDISSKLLKQTINGIITPLVHIINLSLSSGIFPDKMKIAKVIPIFKANEPEKFNNYRPISLLPIFSKVLEKVMFERVYNFMDVNKIFFESQYGFRKKHSTEHALLEVQNRVCKLLENKKIVSGICMDLSKAFDTLNHNILLKKLDYYGIRGIALKWFESYLANRQQFVLINKYKSSYENIVCGVPQGSILGPLLFILYINDIPLSSKKGNFILFADDTNVLYNADNLMQLEEIINTELKQIYDWLTSNKLFLNVGKTKYLIFNVKNRKIDKSTFSVTLNNINIENVSFTKFLGVYLDENLGWNVHMNEKAKQISKITGIMNKLKNFVPQNVLRLIYLSLIQSHLMYGLLVWGSNNLSNKNRLVVLQKKAIRIISHGHYLAHSEPLFKANKILKFSDLYMTKGIRLYCNITDGNLNQNTHEYNTRQSSSIHQKHLISRISKQDLNNKLSKTWNILPYNIREKKTRYFFIWILQNCKKLLSRYLPN